MRVRTKNFTEALEPPRRAKSVSLFFAVALTATAGQLLSWARTGKSVASFPSGSAVENILQLPVGLILPVRLEDTISVREAQKGALIEARIMQAVPVSGRSKIAVRSLVKGAILKIDKDANGEGVKLSLKFDQLEDGKQTSPISTSLRAIASYIAVRTAQTPWTEADAGAPSGWSNTIQIGGDVRYGDGGMVRNRNKQKVGKGVLGGVLVYVQANSALGCEGPINGDDRLQALWVFSADACGVYGLKGMEISHSGNTDPLGEITFHFAKDSLKLDAGTAMLLRIVPKP